jgi:type VI secretion system protein VasD
VVRIYQLERAETFKAASFDELWENDLATLGDAVLVKEEIVMNPADTRKFEMSPHDDTRFVAIMAGFREKNGDRWKDIASVSNSWLGRRIGNSYQVELRGNEIVFE